MTIQDKFDSYLSGYLNLNEADIEKIGIHKDLRKEVEKKLKIKGKSGDETYSFLTGSYVRNTAIRPPKDVDFFVVLDEKAYKEKSPKELLATLEQSLKEIVGDKTVFEQTHSITIEYDEEFSIDVIPAMEEGEAYKIPEVAEDGDSWLISNPNVHKKKLNEANEETKGLLVPIIKLLKSWKRDKCDYVKSFHLELLATEILRGLDVKSYSEGINLFFSKSSDYLREPCIKDPANEQNLVDDYLSDGERKQLADLMAAEREISNNAVTFEKDTEDDKALAEWDKIFVFNPNKKKYIKSNPSQEKQLSYPFNPIYKIGISAKIYNMAKGTYKDNYYSNSRKLPKDWKIRFQALVSNVPEPKRVFWQVVNTGKEAEEANDLRGEILADQGYLLREEHTKYKGTHYINCFVVRDNVCVAKDRFFVKID